MKLPVNVEQIVESMPDIGYEYREIKMTIPVEGTITIDKPITIGMTKGGRLSIIELFVMVEAKKLIETHKEFFGFNHGWLSARLIETFYGALSHSTEQGKPPFTAYIDPVKGKPIAPVSSPMNHYSDFEKELAVVSQRKDFGFDTNINPGTDLDKTRNNNATQVAVTTPVVDSGDPEDFSGGVDADLTAGTVQYHDGKNVNHTRTIVSYKVKPPIQRRVIKTKNAKAQNQTQRDRDGIVVRKGNFKSDPIDRNPKYL